MDEELREKIANGISVNICAKCAGVGKVCDNCRLPQGYDYEIADQILALIKKEGWIPAEATKYVKLAEDQSLPIYRNPNYMILGDVERRAWDIKVTEWEGVQQDMLKVVDGKAFRKVELGVER